jgi:gluconolactonase
MGGEPANGHVKPNKGSLYSLSKQEGVKTHLTGVGISNGMAWSLDHKKFYYIDTPKGTVEEYDFDITSGTISNLQIVFSLKKHNITGALDGMTIDTDGNLWIAIFNGFRVIKIDPRRPETLLDTIPIPSKQVTSVAFGGPDLDQIYVTTASFTVDGVVLPPPHHGATYVITGSGAKGLPASNFQL